MLTFHPPALRRDPPPNGAKSLVFHCVVLVLAAVLVTASLWCVTGSGSANGRNQDARQGAEAAWPNALAHPGRAS